MLYVDYVTFSRLYDEVCDYSDEEMFIAERDWQDWMDPFSAEENVNILHTIFLIGRMNFEDLRNTMNMSQTEMAKKYNISVRTIQNWDSERRNPPDYVIKLLAYTIFLYQINREGNKDDSSEQD